MVKRTNKKGRMNMRKVLIALALVFCFALVGCDDGGYSYHVDTATCKSCGRTFEAGDSAGNYKNIAQTGMCNNCYDNFKWGQSFIGK